MKNYTFFLIFFACYFHSTAQSLFKEVSTPLGIIDTRGSEGVSVVDFNNDGLDDFYVTSIEGRNYLYQNTGDGFKEVAVTFGVDGEEKPSTTSVWGDLNNDGWQDLYVGHKYEADQLFLNPGMGIHQGSPFQEISLMAGIFQTGNPKSVNMADLNNDGFLDIYISNFGSENALYINNGNLGFSNHIYLSGALDVGKAMGTVLFDFDKDGDIDIYLVHDDHQTNLLYRNEGNGRFLEVGEAANVNTKSYGMGVDIGDVNNDGWMDIYIANFGPNFLLLNQGDGTFVEGAYDANVADIGMGWGTNFLDFDSDGRQDIYVVNSSFPTQISYPNALLRNKDALNFEWVERNTDISSSQTSLGAALIDYNLDGRPDIITANRGSGESVQFFQNTNTTGHWLGIKLIGVKSNYNGIGAKLKLADDSGHHQYLEMVAGHSWASKSMDAKLFGLGDNLSTQTLEVEWPAGSVDTFRIEELNRYYTIIENESIIEGIYYDEMTSKIQDESVLPNTVHIFPNPSTGNFTIEFHSESPSDINLFIYNSWGQLLDSRILRNIDQGENVFEINDFTNEGGSFLYLSLMQEDHLYTKKLMLTRQ